MLKIKIKTYLSIIISKIIIKISKILFKGGSNFPGRVALKLDEEILRTVARNYKVIIITGTNGKTTTASMLYNMFHDSGLNVITNNTGANMLPGIISCFVDHYSFKETAEIKYAIMEVDEANVKLVTKYITPYIINITNLFRDQMDRYGEVYTTLKKILEGVKLAQRSTLVLNGDESLLGDLSLGLPNKTLYYGFKCGVDGNKIIDINADAKFCKRCKNPYKYNYISYNHLGDYFCDKCGYKRPELTYTMDKIETLTPEGSLVIIDGNEYYINQPGTYNIYNALSAYSIAKTVGLDNKIIFNSLKSQQSSFGRQEHIDIDGIEVKIILVKNPAGYDQAINTISLDKREINLALLLNDNYADGRDISWIWDVKFEKLSELNIKKILVSGIRIYDMSVRLKIAGLSYDSFALCETYDKLLEEIKSCSSKTVYILATYTAMINLRKFLNTKGYIKKLW